MNFWLKTLSACFCAPQNPIPLGLRLCRTFCRIGGTGNATESGREHGTADPGQLQKLTSVKWVHDEVLADRHDAYRWRSVHWPRLLDRSRMRDIPESAQTSG
jgi:hypothetical protein